MEVRNKDDFCLSFSIDVHRQCQITLFYLATASDDYRPYWPVKRAAD